MKQVNCKYPAALSAYAVYCGTVQRVCAWCGKSLGSYEDSTAPEGAVSHGICPACAEKMREDLARRQQRRLGRKLFAHGYDLERCCNQHQRDGWMRAMLAAIDAGGATVEQIEAVAKPVFNFDRFTANDIVPAEMRDDWVGV